MYKRFIGEVFDDLAQAYDAGYDEDLYAEDEIEAFDPTPPPPGTTLLTRFALGSANLTASHRAALARIAADILRRMPTTQHFFNCFFVDAEGHEDEVGDSARFRQVGLARARAAAQHLARLLNTGVARLPAASQRNVEINVTSPGPARPIRSNVTAEGRAMNRRVEIRWRVGTCPGVA